MQDMGPGVPCAVVSKRNWYQSFHVKLPVFIFLILGEVGFVFVLKWDE